MLAPEKTRAASELLLAHWQAGSRLAGLPRQLRPPTRKDGYAIQAHLERSGAAPLVGWKIAATSPAGQAHINVDGPIAGRILAERLLRPGMAVPLDHNQMRVAEPEFAFRMGTKLPPRARPYEMAEVLAAVDGLHLAIEVPDSRFEDFTSVGAPQLIADNACAHLFLLGEETKADWRDLDLAAHQVVGRVLGTTEREGSGANVLNDPRLALVWLVNELSRNGEAVLAGQIVSTGTCMAPLEVEPGDEVVADFGVLGIISTRFR